MGYYLGTKLEYNPFWEEKEHQEYMTDLQKMYCCGYDAGYSSGTDYLECNRDTLKVLEQENESLRGLLGANIRVNEEEVNKAIEDAEKQVRTKDSETTPEVEASI